MRLVTPKLCGQVDKQSHCGSDFQQLNAVAVIRLFLSLGRKSMKQSPSAGVHTFCDRQKPLPDGAAQYYVAGMGPALGWHWGPLGGLHCLEKQSSTHHTQTRCSEDLFLPRDVPWNCRLFHWGGKLALLLLVQHKRVFVTFTGESKVGYNLSSIGFPGTGPSKAAVESLFGTEVTCAHPADEESVMQYLSKLDDVLLQCSLFTIFYPKMFGFLFFFFNISDQHVQQTSSDSPAPDESH